MILYTTAEFEAPTIKDGDMPYKNYFSRNQNGMYSDGLLDWAVSGNDTHHAQTVKNNFAPPFACIFSLYRCSCCREKYL